MTIGDPQVDQRVEGKRDERIRCVRCRAVVTTHRQAVVRGGAHEHTFRNPAGFSWTIRCFGDAAGCRSAGLFTADASWFAGYQWCLALCRTCGRHLGWWFVGSAPSFIALIVPRIGF